MSPHATPSEVLRTRFVIISLQVIVPMVREAVCDLTAMGWVIILYDCLIQAHTSSSILVFYQYYKPTGVSSPPHVDLTRIAILSTCSIRRSGIPIPAVVCDLTAMGWVTVLNNRLLRLGRIQLREEVLDIQMDCIRPSNLSKIVSTSDTEKVCQGWFFKYIIKIAHTISYGQAGWRY